MEEKQQKYWIENILYFVRCSLNIYFREALYSELGRTPLIRGKKLILAALNGHTATCEALLARGAELEAKDNVWRFRGRCDPAVRYFLWL